MVISWMTREWTKSEVLYGLHPSEFYLKTEGTHLQFHENDIKRFVHKVLLQKLRPCMTYCECLLNARRDVNNRVLARNS